MTSIEAKQKILSLCATPSSEHSLSVLVNIQYSIASTSREPDRNEITRKLLDNATLTGRERAFLIDFLNNHGSLKRKDNSGDVQPTAPEMKNRRIQVTASNLIVYKTTQTQTDELINYQSSLDSSRTNNDIIVQSKKLASAEKIDVAKATDLMAKSFDKRRNYIIVERPAVSLVKERYPLLFSYREVLHELDRILYDGKSKEFLENIGKYAKYILSMADDKDPLLKTINDKKASYQTKVQKDYAEQVGAILMISSLAKESRSFLKLTDNVIDTAYYPYIECNARRNDIFFDQYLFKIYVEGVFLCEAPDFKEALLCLVASYFIFNISYPENAFGTFVFFEKLFLDANDTEDSQIDIYDKQIIAGIKLKYRNGK
ncbi:DUF5641 domain-containing protein [Caerostris extrusa]|uniref:DUF5641 domain-containing protein n=1 Tax=Caerostris extrusa TaxID=172846 RepID=A0AAV4XWB7_CAEEX|nr:DUF5641 domain-containing protein [Caerostris extrusa]